MNFDFNDFVYIVTKSSDPMTVKINKAGNISFIHNGKKYIIVKNLGGVNVYKSNGNSSWKVNKDFCGYSVKDVFRYINN